MGAPLKQRQCNYMEAFHTFAKELQDLQPLQVRGVLRRRDSTGEIARELLSELEDALQLDGDQGPLRLEYQPKVDSTGRVIGAEALLRWRHPIYGSISPLTVVDLCDEGGLTCALGRWVIRNSIAQLKCWKDMGYHGIALSMNINPRQIWEDCDLVETLCDCIRETGVDPRRVELELTENATVDGSDATRRKLEQITAAGVSLSIDDFGMGHSSLLYLCDFPVNSVKIDKALVSGIVGDRTRERIVTAILLLCRQLGVQTVAEGVETQEQAHLLNQLGCQCHQGFYYSASLTSEQFLVFVEQGER